MNTKRMHATPDVRDESRTKALAVRHTVPVKYLSLSLIALWARYATSICGLVAFTALFVLNAYICDDAFMIFRSVDNLLTGHGLTWNPDERVQVYTGPLYTLMLAVAYAPVIGFRKAYDPTVIYLVAMAINYTVSAVSIWYVVRWASGFALGMFVVALFCASQAYVPFTSSGLETPVTLALTIAFYAQWFGVKRVPGDDRTCGLFATASLAVLNRLDSALLFLPALVWETVQLLRRSPRRALLMVAGASVPVLTWLAVATIYYGFPFPNTFYAKVGYDVNSSVLWAMGEGYLRQSIRTDPITLGIVGFGCVVSLVAIIIQREYGWQCTAAMAGSLLGVLYITKIGGDFIGFRFLAAPYVIAVMAVTHGLRAFRTPSWVFGAATAAVVLFQLWWPSSPLRVPWDLPATFDVKYYYQSSALLRYRPGMAFPFGAFHSVESADHCARLRLTKNEVLIHAGGLRGFCSGPRAHTIDSLSITDPLIARLPVPEGLGPHIPGHIVKSIPHGYWASVVRGQNMIEETGLREFYADVRTAISGPLFTWERAKAIWRLHTQFGGRYTGKYIASPDPQPKDNR